jgi:hypothetical protein
LSASLNITRAFGAAFKLYRAHWAVLLLCALVIFAIPVAILSALVVLDRAVEAGAVVLLVLVAIFMQTTGGFWFRAFCTHLVLASRRAEQIRLGVLVRRTFKGFPRVSTVGFLVWFGTIFGLLLFIVPGLIFAARRAPAISVAVVEGKGAFYGRRFRDPEHSAMRRSRDLVKGSGNSFEMFAVIAAKNAVYGTFNTIFPLLFVFAVPWGALAVSLAYFELVDIERYGATPDAGAAAPASQGAAPGEGSAYDSGWRPRPL